MKLPSVCAVREEAQKHMDQAAQQSEKVTELEELLDQVKTKVQDLEDRFLCNTVQLQQDKKEAKVFHLHISCLFLHFSFTFLPLNTPIQHSLEEKVSEPLEFTAS